MDENTEKKKIDIQVMKKMRDLGIINHLNAHFISDFAIAVQDSDLTSLKMYKNINKTTDYQIAADFVLQYLRNYNLNYTLNSLNAETKKKIRPQKDITKKELNFTSNDYLDEALQLYLSNEENPSQIKQQNHEKFREALASRIESLKISTHPTNH